MALNFVGKIFKNGLRGNMASFALMSPASFTGISTVATSIMDLPVSNVQTAVTSTFWPSRASAGSFARPVIKSG